MGKYKIFLFSKECKTGISVFLNLLSNLKDKDYVLDFYFYKKDVLSKHPKYSNFINTDYPQDYGFSFKKIFYLITNLFKTYKIIEKSSLGLIFACDLYSFIVLSLGLMLFNKKNIKLVYLVEVNIKKSIDSKPFVPYRYALRILFRLLIKRVNWFVFPSYDLAKNTIQIFNIDSKKTTVIPYGIDLSKIEVNSRKKIKSSDKKILNSKIIKLFYVGRLDKQKDFFTVLAAFGIIVSHKTDIELYVIGMGDEKEIILKTTEYIKLKNKIHFLGWKNNIYPYLKYADIFLFSSLFEGFGIIILETMASKIPIVATNSPYGPSEILERGKDGILVPIKDYEKMAEKTLELIKNKSLRKKYVLNASKRVKEFDSSKMLKAYDNFFNSLIHNL